MISTGINGLDEMLGTGIPEGSRVLYSLEPGVDGQLFMISTLSCALAKKRSCLVVLPNTTVDAFRNDVQAMYGPRPDLALAPVTFFDSVDWERIQKGSKTPEGRARELQARIRKLCSENHVDVVFVYFDLLNEEFGTDAAAAIFTSALETCQDKKVTLVIEHLNLEGIGLLDRFIGNMKFDLVLAIRSSFRPFPQFNYFTLVHTSWADLPVRSVPFIIGEGRVILYIPRIVVTGPASSGKSTFVLNAADDGHSVDRRAQDGGMTTVALDFGWIRWKDFDITLYGTPGQERFDSLLPSYLGHAMGALLIIDATNADQLPRARLLSDMIARRRIPFAVVVNKNDLTGTLDPELIRRVLAIRHDVPLYQISATRKTDVNFVLESLVDSITQFRY